MDTEIQIDLAFVKRNAAASYVRKRKVLASPVVQRYFTAAELRMMREETREALTTWRAARQLLKDARA